MQAGEARKGSFQLKLSGNSPSLREVKTGSQTGTEVDTTLPLLSFLCGKDLKLQWGIKVGPERKDRKPALGLSYQSFPFITPFSDPDGPPGFPVWTHASADSTLVQETSEPGSAFPVQEIL